MRVALSIVDALGAWVVGVVVYLVEIAALTAVGVRELLWPSRGTRRLPLDVLIRQIYFTGVQAVPFTLLLAALSAVVLVVQAQVQANGVAAGMVGSLIVTLLVRELGPLLTALVVVSRSGTAIATELANMRVAREIDGLEAAGIEPFRYLVLPRLAGFALALTGLTMLYLAGAIGSGFVLARLWLGDAAPIWSVYAESLAANLSPLDPFIILAKTLIPGLLCAAIACREGLACSYSVTAVPRAATAGVVRAIMAVVVWDVLVTVIVFSA